MYICMYIYIYIYIYIYMYIYTCIDRYISTKLSELIYPGFVASQDGSPRKPHAGAGFSGPEMGVEIATSLSS